MLEAHPDVLEAAVLGTPDQEWGEAVTAIVVLRDGVPGNVGVGDDSPVLTELQFLRAHCAAALAAYKVPKRVLLRSEPLPRTRSGKLLRREL